MIQSIHRVKGRCKLALSAGLSHVSGAAAQSCAAAVVLQPQRYALIARLVDIEGLSVLAVLSLTTAQPVGTPPHWRSHSRTSANPSDIAFSCCVVRVRLANKSADGRSGRPELLWQGRWGTVRLGDGQAGCWATIAACNTMLRVGDQTAGTLLPVLILA